MVFFESQKVYDFGEMFVETGVPEGYYEIELGEPSVKRKGKDLTIITLGPALYTAIAAADELQSRFGVSAEVIDLRAANPLNYEPLAESVQQDRQSAAGVRRGGARLRDADGGRHPDAALFRRSGRRRRWWWARRNWITPAAELEALFFPQTSWLLDAIHERILPLFGVGGD